MCARSLERGQIAINAGAQDQGLAPLFFDFEFAGRDQFIKFAAAKGSMRCNGMSALPLKASKQQTSRLGSFVPIADIAINNFGAPVEILWIYKMP